MFSNRSNLLAAAAGLAVLAGCSSHETPAKRESATAPAIAVTAVPALRQEIPRLYEATGTVQARVTTTVGARLMGHLREVRVQAGDRVQAGQLIAVIDAGEIDTSLRQARAGAAEARSALPEVENAIAAARAQLDLAQSTFNRMKSLFDQRSITAQEFDEVSARQRMAEANLRMAEAKKAQLLQRIVQADAAIATIEVQKGYTQVSAPFSGTVIERKAEPGMLAAPGTPIAVIEQAGNYRLHANVEESRLGSIRPGMPAEVRLDALNQSISARVAEIVPTLDPASRTFTAKLDLPAHPVLRTGLFGRARFTLGTQTALTVPSSAVAMEGQVRKVYVASSGMARARLVTAGAQTGDRIEILSGLEAGETVIAPIPAALADGARVEVRR